MSAQPAESVKEVAGVTPLAAAMAERGLSGQQLARTAGVHENSVYAWRAGRSSPSWVLAGRVASALGVPADRLFPDAVGPHRGAAPADDGRLWVKVRGLSDDQRAERADAIGRRLADAMTARELSVNRLAHAAGVSRRTVSNWLAGRTINPDPSVAARLADALGVHPDQLVPSRPVTPLAQAVSQRGWDARQLAAAAGVNPQTARDWLAGTSTPRPERAARVAAALDRQIPELFDTAPDPEQLEPVPVDVRRLPTVDQVLTAPATRRDDWAGDAACAASGQDPEAWWPTQNDPAYEARATCGGCPVQGDCRDSYLDGPDTPEARTAIWAGLPGARLRTLARTHTATASRQPQRDEERASDAATARGTAAARTSRIEGSAPSFAPFLGPGEARSDRPVDPTSSANGRAKVVRPALSAAPGPRDPHAESGSARPVSAEATRTARGDAASAHEKTAASAPPRAVGREPAQPESGMVL